VKTENSIDSKNPISFEVLAGLVLAIATFAALAIANSSFSDAYFFLLNHKLFGLSVQHWVNDGMMTLFFFMVGLEIKREVIQGELRTLSKAALPVAAAIGGMLFPALIYFAFNFNQPTLNGWAIPMATDIAFALAVLSLLGKSVPIGLRVFLLTLAVVDDLGAVAVIALFYTATINIKGLVIAVFLLGIVRLLCVKQVKSYWIYWLLGGLVWGATLSSGVHATIAGVVLGLMTPISLEISKKIKTQIFPLETILHYLHPMVSLLIMPLFAFANAGVFLGAFNLDQMISSSVSSGITLGLLAGKPIGILLFTWLAVTFGFANMSTSIKWRHIFGVSFLAGIGFTMSIFIAHMALLPENLDLAKISILLASVVSGVIGFLFLKFQSR